MKYFNPAVNRIECDVWEIDKLLNIGAKKQIKIENRMSSYYSDNKPVFAGFKYPRMRTLYYINPDVYKTDEMNDELAHLLSGLFSLCGESKEEVK